MVWEGAYADKQSQVAMISVASCITRISVISPNSWMCQHWALENTAWRHLSGVMHHEGSQEPLFSELHEPSELFPDRVRKTADR